MRRYGLMLATAGFLATAVGQSSQAGEFSPTGLSTAAQGLSSVQPAACREKRWGWHGWGWYPCSEQVNTCEKCHWRWGYKYCWKIC